MSADEQLLTLARSGKLENKGPKALEAAIRSLVAKRANIRARDAFGDEALHLAARNGFFKTALALLRCGASFYDKNQAGHTAIEVARAARQVETVEKLTEQQARDNELFEFLGKKERPDLAVFRLFKINVEERGANLFARNVDGNTPFLSLAIVGHLHIMQWVVAYCDEHGYPSPLEDSNPNGITALLHATRNNRINVVAWLLGNGASPTHRDSSKRVFIHICAMEG